MAAISNRVVTIYKRKTSMRLAPAEWEAIETICKRENISRKTLFELIDLNRDEKLGLTSSVRLFSIIYYKNSFINKNKPSSDKSNPTSQIFEAIKEIV